MAAADIFCLPSYREGFGNVIIEAAAVGIPTVGSKIYGIVDAISENETGLVFDVKNVSQLQQCLELLIENNTLRAKLGKNARERALKYFSNQKMTKAWLDFYTKKL